ncbi:hypothetical protein BDR03DRAFT_933676 [Suillus americanus]|nr:hypothetical protein BDR03DRAFT_933676 [Suillus americanus]
MAGSVGKVYSPMQTAIVLGARSLSTSKVLREEATTSPNLGSVQPQKRPVGGFWGGRASVEELQASTEKVSAHVRHIEAVEKDLKALAQSSASKDDLSRVRAELKKVYDGLHIEFLDLRSYVWGMQQDMHLLAKKNTTSVRV